MKSVLPAGFTLMGWAVTRLGNERQHLLLQPVTLGEQPEAVIFWKIRYWRPVFEHGCRDDGETEQHGALMLQPASM